MPKPLNLAMAGVIPPCRSDQRTMKPGGGSENSEIQVPPGTTVVSPVPAPRPDGSIPMPYVGVFSLDEVTPISVPSDVMDSVTFPQDMSGGFLAPPQGSASSPGGDFPLVHGGVAALDDLDVIAPAHGESPPPVDGNVMSLDDAVTIQVPAPGSEFGASLSGGSGIVFPDGATVLLPNTATPPPIDVGGRMTCPRGTLIASKPPTTRRGVETSLSLTPAFVARGVEPRIQVRMTLTVGGLHALTLTRLVDPFTLQPRLKLSVVNEKGEPCLLEFLQSPPLTMPVHGANLPAGTAEVLVQEFVARPLLAGWYTVRADWPSTPVFAASASFFLEESSGSGTFGPRG